MLKEEECFIPDLGQYFVPVYGMKRDVSNRSAVLSSYLHLFLQSTSKDMVGSWTSTSEFNLFLPNVPVYSCSDHLKEWTLPNIFPRTCKWIIPLQLKKVVTLLFLESFIVFLFFQSTVTSQIGLKIFCSDLVLSKGSAAACLLVICLCQVFYSSWCTWWLRLSYQLWYCPTSSRRSLEVLLMWNLESLLVHHCLELS